MEWQDNPFPVRRKRVLVVDDQVSVREMVAVILNREEHYAVSAEASSGFEGLRLFRRYRPELVITGLALPEMNGPEMIHAMREERPEVRVLVYSGARNGELVAAGLAAEPHGFVHKTESLDVLRRAVSAVAGGFTFFGSFATQARDEGRAQAAGRTDGLSPKLRVVLQLVAQGLSTKQVADRLSLSAKTVEHYRTQLMQRLGLRDVASLTRYAVRAGLVE